jgi:signal transduction histidine kinase
MERYGDLLARPRHDDRASGRHRRPLPVRVARERRGAPALIAMSLRNRIMLLVALGLVIATVPLGLMGLEMVRAATDRVLEERLVLARVAADHLSEQLVLGWWQLDRLGTRAASFWDAGTPDAVSRDFAALSPLMTLFSGGVFLVDRTGRVLAQELAPSAMRLSSITRGPTLRAVFQTRARQHSGIEWTDDGHPVVVFAVPVPTSGGGVMAAVGGVIDLSKPTLLTFIAGVAQGTSGHAAIVAHDGVVLASTDEGELYTRNEHPDFFARFIAANRPLVDSAEEDHGPGAARDIHVMAFAPIASVSWGVGIGQSEEETFGPIRRLRDRIVGFEVLVLAAALLFAWMDTSAVAAPLRLLQEASTRIAGGDLDRAIEVHRTDEIGSLARSFEAMRIQLRRSLDENARLQERLQSVAMVEERERIAREIHDSVGQVLGYVNTKAQAVTVLLEGGKVEQAQTQLAQLEHAAREVYADLREAILGLRASNGVDGQLVTTVTEYVERFSTLSSLDVSVVIEGDPVSYAFSSTTELHLVRIIQEALTNIRKHAGAHAARVRFSTEANAVLVTISDDGIGLLSTDGAPAHPVGFGLQMMRERAEAIGGTFTVRSRAGGGTEVRVRLPAGEGRAMIASPAR